MQAVRERHRQKLAAAAAAGGFRDDEEMLGDAMQRSDEPRTDGLTDESLSCSPRGRQLDDALDNSCALDNRFAAAASPTRVRVRVSALHDTRSCSSEWGRRNAAAGGRPGLSPATPSRALARPLTRALPGGEHRGWVGLGVGAPAMCPCTSARDVAHTAH